MRIFAVIILFPLLTNSQSKDDKPIPRNPIKNHTSKVFIDNKLRMELFSDEFVALDENSAALKGISATILDKKGNSTIKAKYGNLKNLPNNTKQLSLTGAVTVESGDRVARTEQIDVIIKEKETLLSTELPFSAATPEFILNAVGMKSNESLNPISMSKDASLSTVQSPESSGAFSAYSTGPAYFQDFNNGIFFVRISGNGKLVQLKDGVEKIFFADEIRALCQKTKMKTEPLYFNSWGKCRMESPDMNGNCDELAFDFATGSFSMNSIEKSKVAGNGYVVESKSIYGNSIQRSFHCPTRSTIRSQEHNFTLESDTADGFLLTPPSLTASGACTLTRDTSTVFAQNIRLENNEVTATDPDRVLVKTEKGNFITSRIRFFETGAASCTGWNTATFLNRNGKISRVECEGPVVYSQEGMICPMRCRISSEGLYAEGNSAELSSRESKVDRLVLPDGEFAISDRSAITFLRMETDEKANSASFYSPQGCTVTTEHGTVYADVITFTRPGEGKTRINARSVTNRCKIILKGGLK